MLYNPKIHFKSILFLASFHLEYEQFFSSKLSVHLNCKLALNFTKPYVIWSMPRYYFPYENKLVGFYFGSDLALASELDINYPSIKSNQLSAVEFLGN